LTDKLRELALRKYKVRAAAKGFDSPLDYLRIYIGEYRLTSVSVFGGIPVNPHKRLKTFINNRDPYFIDYSGLVRSGLVESAELVEFAGKGSWMDVEPSELDLLLGQWHRRVDYSRARPPLIAGGIAHGIFSVVDGKIPPKYIFRVTYQGGIYGTETLG
jgi:hypothetical protein